MKIFDWYIIFEFFLFNYITIKMDICKKNNYLNAIKK
jgi:hypothetical protein